MKCKKCGKKMKMTYDNMEGERYECSCGHTYFLDYDEIR